MYKYLRVLTILLFFQFSSAVNAQEAYVVIQELRLVGNKKTKDRVVLREMDMFPADTILLKEMAQRIILNEKRLLSTALFTDVNINIKNWDTQNHTCDLVIEMQENWYIYPSLIFELADRNFNVWWQEQNRSFDRVNYGLRVDHINLTGHRDRLKVKFQLGYTRKYELRYDYPYLNMKWGFSSSVFFSENKEIGYITQGNKTLFHKEEDERRLRSRFRLGGTVNYRPGLFTFNALHLGYHYNTIDEVIATEYNPDYFLNGATSLRFFLLEYDIQHDRRVFFQYPEGGHLFFFNIKKEGLGIYDEYNNLSVFAGLEKYFSYKRKWIYALRLKGKTNLVRDKIAFANNTGLGYGSDVVSGYELYVLDGTDYFLFQSSLKYRLVDTVKDLGDNMPLNQFRRMSIKVFLRFNLDTGYVNEPTYTVTNDLNNQWIVGYGPAIDIILWNTFIIKAEYGFNELGESGFILQSGLTF
jgi:outer membrane protein assembly factor BamA